MFIGGPHKSIQANIFGKLMLGGVIRAAPGINTAIKAWGANANRFLIDSNKISDYRCAMSITDALGGSDPAVDSIITNNTLYCVPDCGGGQLYVAGKTLNVKIMKNTINGGWSESENRDTVHSYGIEIDSHVSYISTGSNQIFNNSISGIWIGNGAPRHHRERNCVQQRPEWSADRRQRWAGSRLIAIDSRTHLEPQRSAP